MARAEHEVLAVHPRWRIVGGELAGRICDVGEPGGRFLLLAVDRDIAEALVEYREASTGLVLRLASALSVADPEGLAAILADAAPVPRMAVADSRPTGELHAAEVARGRAVMAEGAGSPTFAELFPPLPEATQAPRSELIEVEYRTHDGPKPRGKGKRGKR